MAFRTRREVLPKSNADIYAATTSPGHRRQAPRRGQSVRRHLGGNDRSRRIIPDPDALLYVVDPKECRDQNLPGQGSGNECVPCFGIYRQPLFSSYHRRNANTIFGLLRRWFCKPRRRHGFSSDSRGNAKIRRATAAIYIII